MSVQMLPSESAEDVDLLMVNATNYPRTPIYPYAFVQVGAIAKRAGLRTARLELFAHQPQDRPAVVAATIAKFRPRVVGIHIRQADSLVFDDYHGLPPDQQYRPLDDSRGVIEMVRRVSDVPILAGGFGLTTQPGRVVEYIGADYGILGEPDGVLRGFSSLCSTGVDLPNLIRVDSGTALVPERVFYPPLDEREYDEATWHDLERFYGKDALLAPDGPTVAVELARGCPYRCYFCTEPAVKGRGVRERDLQAVMADAEFLASKGARQLWLICSELNIGGADLALRTAEAFIRLRERTGADLSWRAYVLPRWLDADALRVLRRSGFAGGWNDFPSLDDANLRATSVPYRAAHVLEHVQATLDAGIVSTEPGRPRLSLFLGNAFASIDTIVATLDRVDEHLAGRFKTMDVSAATRLFDSVLPALPSGAVEDSVCFSPGARDLVQPTFYFSPALVDAFGTREDVVAFMEYARTTLLGPTLRRSPDWAAFLRTTSDPDRLSRLVQRRQMVLPPGDSTKRWRAMFEAVAVELTAGVPGAAVRQLFVSDAREVGVVSRALCATLAKRPSDDAASILAHLGLEPTVGAQVSAWRLFRACAPRYESATTLLDDVATQCGIEPDSLAAFQLRCLMVRCDLRLTPAYHRAFRYLRTGASAS